MDKFVTKIKKGGKKEEVKAPEVETIPSFPKLYHWLTPQRKIRYVLRNCPLYFYTKNKIKINLKIAGIKKYKILDNGREYFVIGYCSK